MVYSEYVLRKVPIDETNEIIVLAKANSASFIEEMANDPKHTIRAESIVKATLRVCKYGVKWAKNYGCLHTLDSALSLLELKSSNSTLRVMTYVHDETTPIYLFDFDGHKGKTGQIPKSCLEKGRTLAQVAHECALKEGI